MSCIKKSLDIVVFGGGGFIGSAILREGLKRSLAVIPVGRNVTTTKLSCNNKGTILYPYFFSIS